MHEIFGAAFAHAVRRLAEHPDIERLLLARLDGQVVGYLDLLAWWQDRVGVEPDTAKHALDLIMARLSLEGRIAETARRRRDDGVLVPEWTLTDTGAGALRAATGSGVIGSGGE